MTTDAAELYAECAATFGGLFTQMEWAEDEIAKARDRHGETEEHGPLWSAFRLLTPTHDMMATEFVYRAHCHDLLERVAAGLDTRSATDVELACACASASLVAPLTPAGTGLYLRVWHRRFPERSVASPEDLDHYESLYASRIDDLEHQTARGLRVADRTTKPAKAKRSAA